MSFKETLFYLSNFLSDEIYEKKIEKFFSHKYSTKIFNTLSSSFLNQTNNLGTLCAIYNFSSDKSILKYVTEVIVHSDQLHNIIKFDTSIILRMTHPEKFAQFIKTNNNRFLWVPFGYDSEYIESLHQASILIDTKVKTIYLIDPNGSGEYFNSTVGSTGSDIVENCLEQYFKQLEIYGLKEYVFMKTDLWNPKHICLNSSKLNKYTIGGGKCVILSILLIHLTVLIDKSVISGYLLLHRLSDDELVYIIEKYMVAVYRECLV
jgi:hypothetical protein